jgi:aminoglycoside phosphotransferase (APT) family kinase protein
MRFVSRSTSIPIPKVLCAFKSRGKTYILMERIDGDILGNGWTKRSAKSQAEVLTQLKKFIQELRAIPSSTSEGVANVDGGPLLDLRLPGQSPYFGPFRNVQEFHSHLRNGTDFHPGNDPDINRLVTSHHADWPLVFTHADLSSLKILARGDKVVAIMDWESAGWYPAYWEYTTACYVSPRNSFWREGIDHLLDPYPAELAMEKIRQRFFGDY